MIYKFKSAATGDLVMLGPQGDQLLRLLGREPAAKGIIETAAMPAVLSALQAAIAEQESAGRSAGDAEADASACRAKRSFGRGCTRIVTATPDSVPRATAPDTEKPAASQFTAASTVSDRSAVPSTAGGGASGASGATQTTPSASIA